MSHFDTRLRNAVEKFYRDASEGNRNPTLNKVAYEIGGTLHWPGACREAAESALREAGENVGLSRSEARTTVRGALRAGSQKPLAAPPGPTPVSVRSTHPSIQTSPPEHRLTPTWVASEWHGLAPIHTETGAAQYLASRGIDPAKLEECDGARVLPLFPSSRLEWWAKDARRLVFRTFDEHGRVRSLKGRILRAPRDENEPKSKGIGGAPIGRSVLANSIGQRLLAGDATAIETVRDHGTAFVEGELDLLTWDIARDFKGAIFGVFQGAWCEDFAQDIPDGTDVFLRPHGDPAGRGYMRAVAQSLRGRCNIWAPPLPSPDGDENDQLLAGTLPAHPRDDSAPYLVISEGGFSSAGIAVDIATARDQLNQIILDAIQSGGIHAIRAGTGAGKTYAAVRHAIRVRLNGGTVRWLAREDQFAEEIVGVFREAAREVEDDESRAWLLRDINGALDTGRNRNNCTYYDQGPRQADNAAPGGASKVCSECPERAGCEWLRRKAARAKVCGGITITTHAKEVETGGTHRADLLVVDEDPTGVLIAEESFTARDVATWDIAGDLGTMTPEQRDALIGAIIASDTEKKPTFDLAPFFEGVDLGESDNAAQQALQRIENDPHGLDKGTDADWHRAAPWRALRALRSASTGRIENGQATVSRIRPGAIGNARTTIVLDATATSPRIASLFGRGARFHDINAAGESALAVTHLTGWSPSHYSLNPDSNDLTWLRLNTCLDHLVNDKTLVVLPKKVRNILRGMIEPPKWFETASDSGHIVHYRQAGASGSNRHRECTQVVALPHWIPAPAKASRCAVYASLTGTDPAIWGDEVVYETEVASLIQAVGRAREGTALYILGGKRTYGFKAESVHVDLYNWQTCGGPWRGKACFEALARDAVSKRDGCSVLSAKSLVSHAVVDPPIGNNRTLPNGAGHPTVAQITTALRDHYGGSWARFARAAGLDADRVETSRGGYAGGLWVAWDSAHGGPPSPETIERRLLDHAPSLTWYRLPKGERVRLVDPLARYREAIRICGESRIKPSARRLGELAGVSKSTAHRALQTYGADIERLHREAMKPRRAWSPPKVQTVDLRVRARSRVRDRVPPKWHAFLQEHGYLIGRVPTSRGAPPEWAGELRDSSRARGSRSQKDYPRHPLPRERVAF